MSPLTALWAEVELRKLAKITIARYSAATTARGVARPAENRGGIPGYRYHDCWLHNLLISASLAEYRCPLLQDP